MDKFYVLRHILLIESKLIKIYVFAKFLIKIDFVYLFIRVVFRIMIDSKIIIFSESRYSENL